MAKMFYRELVHLKDNENDNEIIRLFQKVYEQDREPVFQKRARTVMDIKNSLNPVPRSQRILVRPDLTELFDGKEEGNLETRNKIIQEAFTLYAYTQSDIAEYLNLSRSSISKIICKTR